MNRRDKDPANPGIPLSRFEQVELLPFVGRWGFLYYIRLFVIIFSAFDQRLTFNGYGGNYLIHASVMYGEI